MGYGMLAVTFVRTGIHFERRGFLQPGADGAFRLFDCAFHKGYIGALFDGFSPIILQLLLHLFAFGEHHHTGGVAVQPVYNKDAVAGAGQPDMLHQLAVRGLFILVAGGDGEQACILVDYNQIVILMHDGHSEQLFGLYLLFYINRNNLARLKRVVMPGDALAVH
ncbi:hypothetical protein D3C73_1328580 [compost metagenome]